MIFERGDVVLVLFPNSDLRTAKKRPVIIIQSDHLATGLQQHVVAMISSNLDRANHASRVLVHLDTTEGKNSGLLTDSVIMTDNIATIRDGEFDRKLGKIKNMTRIDEALYHTLGL